MVSEVSAFQASDGKLFLLREAAVKHEVRILHAQKAMNWIRLNARFTDEDEITITPDGLVELLLDFTAQIAIAETTEI